MIKYLMLEPTNRCNLNCTFCNRRVVVKKQHDINIDDWNSILYKLRKHPVEVVKVQGLGESYLHSEFDILCEMVRRYFPSSYIISSTNCQYELGRVFKRSLKYINLLYLSVDGFEDTYEKFRVGAKWSTLVKFLDDLKHIDHGVTDITINYVVNINNYMDIEKLHTFVSEKYPFISEIRLNIAQWWSENQELREDYTDDFYNVLRKYKGNVKGKAPWTYSDCWWPREGFIADVFGDVRICLLNTTTEPIGNILKQPLDEILNSEKRLKVRKECEYNTPGRHCWTCDYKRLSAILSKILL